MFKCEICNEEFENGRVKSNHVRWKHKEQKYSKEGYEKLIFALKEKAGKEIKEITNCDKCGKEIEIVYREKGAISRHGTGRKKKYFCSDSCRHSREFSEEARNKKREKLFGIPTGNGNGILKNKKCIFCGKDFLGKNKTSFCSRKCTTDARKKNNLEDLKVYRQRCSFDFSLNDYPEEFDFNLIENYGWYKAKNHGDNLNGVSRDHKVSVRYGFENKIPPEIIKHPANCTLLIHNENVSKGKDCSITIEELYAEIEVWNKKYK